jgi:sugar phosphate permease
MAIGFYCIFIYNLSEINFVSVSLAIIVVAVLFIVLEFFVIKPYNLIYKHKDRKFNGTFGYLIGSAIGSIILSFVRSKFGKDGEFILVISICLLGFLGLFYCGLFFVKKSQLIKKYDSNDIIIIYGDEIY